MAGNGFRLYAFHIGDKVEVELIIFYIALYRVGNAIHF